MALGYPNSRNKKLDHAKRQARSRRATYAASALRDDKFAESLGITGADHLFVKYEKRSQDASGAIVKSFSPVGMSGGALIDLGKVSSPSNLSSSIGLEFRLAALLIEIHLTRNRMVAVKIGTVLSALD